jgi:hypothetical protein
MFPPNQTRALTNAWNDSNSSTNVELIASDIFIPSLAERISKNIFIGKKINGQF